MEGGDKPSPMFIPLLLTTLGLALASPFTSCPGGYRNGQKFKEGSFVKQCTISAYSYSIDIIGCLTSRGTEMPLGTILAENNLTFNCIQTAGGGATLETWPVTHVTRVTSSDSAGPKENMKCDGKYVNGEQFIQGQFVRQCFSTPYSSSILVIRIIGCRTPSGKEIAVGGSAQEGKLVYNCIETEGGGARLEARGSLTN